MPHYMSAHKIDDILIFREKLLLISTDQNDFARHGLQSITGLLPRQILH
jgi:hypothetical protein